MNKNGTWGGSLILLRWIKHRLHAYSRGYMYHLLQMYYRGDVKVKAGLQNGWKSLIFWLGGCKWLSGRWSLCQGRKMAALEHHRCFASSSAHRLWPSSIQDSFLCANKLRFYAPKVDKQYLSYFSTNWGVSLKRNINMFYYLVFKQVSFYQGTCISWYQKYLSVCESKNNRV